MTRQTRGPRVHERWAHLRFSVIGQLLAAPPAKGELKAAIEGLAGRPWQHPTTSEPVRFGFSTIEHWYYRALKERTDPVGVLRRKVRANAGRQHAISAHGTARFARSLWNLGTRSRLINGPSSNPREYHSQVVPPALLSLVQAPRHIGLGADHGAAGSAFRLLWKGR
jgi:hypothetical protein